VPSVAIASIEELPTKDMPEYRATLQGEGFKQISYLEIKICGNARGIWKKKRASEVKNTSLSVYGVGNGISNMAVRLIESMYDFRFPDLDCSRMDIKPDVHTMRVLYRLGVSTTIREDGAIFAARFINPSYPGEIDGPLWLLGRKLCQATNPDCGRFPINAVCLKLKGKGSRWNSS